MSPSEIAVTITNILLYIILHGMELHFVTFIILKAFFNFNV